MSESDSSNSRKHSGDGSDAQTPDTTALIALSGGDDTSANSEADLPGGWRFESQRWLATLNPGRTQREYQKAVSYFFVYVWCAAADRSVDIRSVTGLSRRAGYARDCAHRAPASPVHALRSTRETQRCDACPAAEDQRGEAAEGAADGPVRRAIQARSHLPQSTSGSPRCGSSSSIVRSTGLRSHLRLIRFVRLCGVSALSADDHIRRWQSQSGRNFWRRRACQRTGSQALPLGLKQKDATPPVQRVPGVCRVLCEKRPAS